MSGALAYGSAAVVAASGIALVLLARRTALAREIAALRARRSWRRVTAAYVRGDMRSPVAVAELATARPLPGFSVTPAAARVTVDLLDRLEHERAAVQSDRGREWRYTLLYLRGSAGLAGRLPVSFDRLVDEVGELPDSMLAAA